MFGKKEIIRKPPITATQRWSGTGIGKTRTLSLGLITASVPPRANIAPEAPKAMSKGKKRTRSNSRTGTRFNR